MANCPGCGRRTPTPRCLQVRRPCESYCAGCTVTLVAAPLDGYAYDLLTCSVCGWSEVTHRGIRTICSLCAAGRREGERTRRRFHREFDVPGFTLVGFTRCRLPVRQRRLQYEPGWGLLSEWYRHQQCGTVNPRNRFPLRNRAGVEAPPFCVSCGGPEWEPDEPRIAPDAPDLLYLVGFPGFVKVGRTLEPGRRLRGHLVLAGSRLIQVVGGRHDRVAWAESEIKRACASLLLTEPHAYMGHFGLTETFRPRARSAIGDLRDWVGRGARDRGAEFGRRRSAAP